MLQRDKAMNSGRRNPRGAPGVVLVVTLLLVGLLLVMGMTLIDLASSDYQVANNESRSIQALFNADAGSEEAKMRLSPNAPAGAAIPVGTTTSWRAYLLSGRTQAEIQDGLDPTYGKAQPGYTTAESTSNYVFYNTVQSGSNAIPWGWARIQHLVDGGGNIVYQNAVTGADTSTPNQVVSGTIVYNPPVLVITAEGISGPVRRMINMQFRPIISTTTTNTDIVTDPFARAIHAKGTVTLVGGAWSDSFDSRNGPYHSINNRGHRGDVSTDATAAGSVSVETNSTIDGSALVGPGGNPTTAIANNGTITGTTGVEPSIWNMPFSQIPPGVVNQGPLSVSGNRTYVLSEGTYWFSSISVTGNAQIKATGAVQIYVTGIADIGGNGVATANNLPPNLLIYGTVDPTDSTKKCTVVKIHGNGDFYGAVYAPAAAMDVYGNGAVYGALTGDNAKVNGNGGFHYDESLGNLGRFVTTNTSTSYTTTGFRRYSWRELAF
jgi:hypothetical protein